MKKVAIDSRGGDSPEVTTQAALAAATSKSVEVVLFGDPDYIREIARSHQLEQALDRLNIVECSTHSAEMRSISEALGQGRLDAWVTPTKSRLLWATLRSGRLVEENLISPALMAPLPTENTGGLSFLMDVGLTRDVHELEIYAQWAKLGARFLEEQYGLPAAETRVGLYYIAEELARAPEWIQLIDARLRLLEGVKYVGLAEPARIRKGEVDLWLAPGIIGNGLMKTLEQWLTLASKRVPAKLEAYGQVEAAATVRGIFRAELSYDAFLISPVIGLKGRVVVCRTHGAATVSQITGGIASVQRYLRDPAPA